MMSQTEERVTLGRRKDMEAQSGEKAKEHQKLSLEGLQYQPNLPLLHQGLACEDGTSGSDRDEYAMMDQEILDSELMELAMNTYKF